MALPVSKQQLITSFTLLEKGTAIERFLKTKVPRKHQVLLTIYEKGLKLEIPELTPEDQLRALGWADSVELMTRIKANPEVYKHDPELSRIANFFEKFKEDDRFSGQLTLGETTEGTEVLQFPATLFGVVWFLKDIVCPQAELIKVYLAGSELIFNWQATETVEANIHLPLSQRLS
jgi:hypothetical protein